MSTVFFVLTNGIEIEGFEKDEKKQKKQSPGLIYPGVRFLL